MSIKTSDFFPSDLKDVAIHSIRRINRYYEDTCPQVEKKKDEQLAFKWRSMIIDSIKTAKSWPVVFNIDLYRAGSHLIIQRELIKHDMYVYFIVRTIYNASYIYTYTEIWNHPKWIITFQRKKHDLEIKCYIDENCPLIQMIVDMPICRMMEEGFLY